MKSINAEKKFFLNPTAIHDLKKKKKKTTLKIENKGEFPLPDKEYLQKPYR